MMFVRLSIVHLVSLGNLLELLAVTCQSFSSRARDSSGKQLSHFGTINNWQIDTCYTCWTSNQSSSLQSSSLVISVPYFRAAPHVFKNARQQGKSWPILSTRPQSCQGHSHTWESIFPQHDHQAPAIEDVNETSDMTPSLAEARALIDQGLIQCQLSVSCQLFEVPHTTTPSWPARHTETKKFLISRSRSLHHLLNGTHPRFHSWQLKKRWQLTDWLSINSS